MQTVSTSGPDARVGPPDVQQDLVDLHLPLSPRVRAVSAFLLDHPSILLPLGSQFADLRPIFESSIRGPSMFPAIPSRARLRVQLQGLESSRRGDVVFYLGKDGYMVHRVVYRGRGGAAQNYLLTLGDNQIAADPPVREDQVLGTVIAVHTAGGWRSLDQAAAAPFYRRVMRGVALAAMIAALSTSVSAAQRLAAILMQAELMSRLALRRLRVLCRPISSVAKRIHGRARFEASWAKSAFARVLDRARHRDVTYSEIDVARMNALFPVARRVEIVRTISDVAGKQDNPAFFENLGRYGRRYRNVPRGIPVLNDVYAPNLAVLDFLTRQITQPDSETLLDFPCGIGVLLVYARRLGFTHTYGFDNWSQVARLTAVRFLEQYGLNESALPSAKDLATIPATIVTCIGVPFTLLEQMSEVLAKPSVRYVLLDCQGRPATLPGFRRTAEYPGLLSIFQKCPS